LPRQPGKILHNPKVYVSNYNPLIKLLYREQSFCRDKVIGAAVQRAVAMVFASPSAKFCIWSISRCLSGRSHLDNFIMKRNISQFIGTVQKHMSTLTRSATNPTTETLAQIFQYVTIMPSRLISKVLP
jgi:hypothetical protein